MRWIIGLAAGLVLTGAAAADDPDVAERRAWMEEQGSLAWIEGHWRRESEGRVSEEIWTNGEGGLYLGVNRSIRDGQARAFEYMRIVNTDEGMQYCAQPGGGEAVCFRYWGGEAGFNMETREPFTGQAVFVNPDHDFPQRIVYARDGNELAAIISDMDGENAITFRWTRVEN
ncbi:DUF6265 family protein [Hyphobacterium sp.]|uniref:DUF6265 family protein n=1 Tax=Hyphobacterium sp. TaxID=2004662 RepID=UPI003BAA50A7